ncbi:hypothetical protein [Streptomyces sp. NPDC026294]|uniref:hypothetical protein n=1 Tax=unclassified Streptomyces TaxID=2593676 RepID=UPI0033CE2B05
MRASIRTALERSAELTRSSQLVDALRLGEAAVNQATEEEQAEVRQWLADHADDFTGRGH